MKDWILKMIKQKEASRTALKEKGSKSENLEEVRSISAQVESIDKEISEFRKQLDELDVEERSGKEIDQEEEHGNPEGNLDPIAVASMRQGQISEEEKREKDLGAKYEKRGADLKAKRSVTYDLDEIPELRATTIGSGTLVAEKKYSNTLNPTFSEVSRVIDVVNAVPLMGGESYEKGFEVSTGEGDYTTETGDYSETDPVFDYVSINKAKITAYTEMSDEAMKLPNVDYQSRVRNSITKAIRKKISKQILVGAGGANALTGIFNAPTKVIPLSSDIEIPEIDADTLDNIVINYGGDEEVEGMGYLVLSKKDLAAFASVRTADGKKQYKIKVNGNTGTISSDESFEVPFIINSVCPALSAAGTADGTYCMVYGMMQAYEMPVFSALTVEESRDFKFKSGQVAYRGSVWAGGNVAMYKGFVRVKKVVAV
jgi:HK97 family phage major capsid protein